MKKRKNRQKTVTGGFVLGRFYGMTLFLLFLLILVLIGLALTIIRGDAILEAYRNQESSSYRQILYATRGSIYDRKGDVLAMTETTYDVVIDPLELQAAEPGLQDSTIRTLAQILGMTDTTRLSRYLDPEYKDSRYEKFSEGWNVNESTKVQIENRISRGVMKGVWLEAIRSRRYPNGELAAHVIGFNENYGIEGYYDRYLTGTDGLIYSVTTPETGTVVERTDAVNGSNVISTLDKTVQYYLEQTLMNVMKDQECERVTGIVINPNTGEILGMGNCPTFDLNHVDNVTGLSIKYPKERLQEADFLPGVWSNFAISGTYQPGSTFKPIFSSIALDTGAIDGSTKFECEGTYDYYDQTFKCAFFQTHGIETIREVIANSCNIGMIQVSENVRIRDYMAYQKTFGLGQYTGIDLPDEVNASEVIYTEGDMGVIELATTSFGQGFNLTPIQLMRAECAVANGGYLITPHVVSRVLDDQGGIVYKADNTPLRQIISEEVSQIVREGMKGVVDDLDLGPTLNAYHIGGKTGTAEKGDYEDKTYVVSFTAFVPIEDPQVGILIVLDEAKSNTSSAAVTAAADVLTNILPYLNIYP